MVSVVDYLTPTDQALLAAGTLFDATYAFEAAQSVSLAVSVPEGRFGLIRFQPKSGLNLTGVSPRGTVLKQLDPEQPAINAISDATMDQLLNINMSGFLVSGADEYSDSSTFAVFLAAGGTPAPAVRLFADDRHGAITDCDFEYYAENTYTALSMEGMTYGNIYGNRFVVVGQGHRGTAARTGGPYNDYDLFLTQCDGYCIEDTSDNSEIRVIGENTMRFSGQRNFIRPVIEGVVVPVAAADTGIIDANHNNTYINPTVNLFKEDVGKLAFAFRGFPESVWINPQIVGEGSVSPLYPFGDTFGPVTVIGGRGKVATIESYHSDPVGNDQRRFDRFTLIGQNDGLSNRATPTAHKVFAPSANVIATYDPSWASIEVNSTLDPLPHFQLDMVGPPPIPGRRLVLVTNKAITAMVYAGASWGDTSALPTSLPAGGSINAIYSANANKWFSL